MCCTSKKQDPEKVAKDMRRARDESGARLFSIEEFLMPQQPHSSRDLPCSLDSRWMKERSMKRISVLL